MKIKFKVGDEAYFMKKAMSPEDVKTGSFFNHGQITSIKVSVFGNECVLLDEGNIYLVPEQSLLTQGQAKEEQEKMMKSCAEHLNRTTGKKEIPMEKLVNSKIKEYLNQIHSFVNRFTESSGHGYGQKSTIQVYWGRDEKKADNAYVVITGLDNARMWEVANKFNMFTWNIEHTNCSTHIK